MRSLVPGKDFRSWLNSGSHKKYCGSFCDSQWSFVLKKLFVLSPFGWWRINTSRNNRTNFNGWAYRREKSGKPIFTVFRRHQRSTGIFFSLLSTMTLKSKMKLPEGSWDKILHSKSRTQCFWKEEIFFSGGLSLEAIDQSSGSSFRVSLVKTTEES